MARTYSADHCPDQCSGGDSGRQMVAHDALLGQLPAIVQKEIKAHGGARRCTYCGLVYLYPKIEHLGRLGYWNSGVRGEGWVGKQ